MSRTAQDSPGPGAGAAPAELYWLAALFGLGYVSYFKYSPILAWLPVDLSVVCAVGCAVGILVQALHRRARGGPAAAAVTWLWGTFAIGAVVAADAGHDTQKMLLLATVTPVAAVAPAYLLRGAYAQRLWLWWTVGVAALMAVAALTTPDHYQEVAGGRFSLEGSSTIGTARVIGAGTLVAVVFALCASRRRWAWRGMVAAGTAMLVVVDSRGPLLALVVSVGLVVLLARVFKGARATAAGISLLAVAGLWYTISTSSIRSADRLVRFVSGEDPDFAREFLFRQAWDSTLHSPLGVGWGGFSELPLVYARYAGEPVYPHNIVLEIFAEGGWLAGAAFLVFAYLSIRNYRRASVTPELAALFGLGVYWLLVAQTSSDINGNRMTWISLSLGLVVTAGSTRRVEGARDRGRDQPASWPLPPYEGVVPAVDRHKLIAGGR